MMVAITIVFLAKGASAQDDPTVGITMGYPASFGVVWHVTDRVALRPELFLSRTSSDNTTTSSIPLPILGTTVTTTTTVTTVDSWQAGTGLSALFYVSTHDALRTYVSPRWTYARTSIDSGSGLGGLNFGSTSATHSISGSFGAQYAVGRRFNVFGEVGLAFSRTVNTPNDRGTSSAIIVTRSDGVGRTVTTRSGAGVILYF
jgi:hypothetical protein